MTTVVTDAFVGFVLVPYIDFLFGDMFSFS
jgi:hypothetical protein